MGQVNDRIPTFVYLMKHIVTKQANDVSITGFRPPELVAEAVNNIRQEGKDSSWETYSGRSLMNPSLDIKRTSRPFSSSLINSPSN